MNRRRAQAALLWMGALGLLALSLRGAPLADIGRALRDLSPGALLLLAVVNGAALVVFSGRWWVILRALGCATGLRRLAAYRLAAFGATYLTPGPQFGGEPLQVLLLTRRAGIPAGSALASVALDKTLELVANFTVLALGVLVLLRSGVVDDLLGPTTAVIALLLLLFPLVYLLALRQNRRPATRLLGLLPTTRLHALQTVASEAETKTSVLCRDQPAAVGAALAVSGASWLLQIGEFWLMLTLIGVTVDLPTALALLALQRLAYLLPFPAGLGALEAALLLGFERFGLPPALALTAAILIRARDLLLALVGLWWGLREVRRGPAAAFGDRALGEDEARI